MKVNPNLYTRDSRVKSRPNGTIYLELKLILYQATLEFGKLLFLHGKLKKIVKNIEVIIFRTLSQTCCETPYKLAATKAI